MITFTCNILPRRRMAGHLIALLRVLRLKPPLQATVTSNEFRNLHAFEGVSAVVLNENFWKHLFFMCRALYAVMRVLRLADMKSAGMDKLEFFVRQADRIMPIYLKQAEEQPEGLLSDTIVSILEATDDAASGDVGGMSDDDEEESESESEDEEEVASDDNDEGEDDSGDELEEFFAGEGRQYLCCFAAAIATASHMSLPLLFQWITWRGQATA